jgi:hypothetical protein
MVDSVKSGFNVPVFAGRCVFGASAFGFTSHGLYNLQRKNYGDGEGEK